MQMSYWISSAKIADPDSATKVSSFFCRSTSLFNLESIVFVNGKVNKVMKHSNAA